MKKITGVIILVLFMNNLAFCSTNYAKKEKNMKEMKIKMSFDNNEIIVKLFDNKTSASFIEQLPLTIKFEDYVGKEKISYLQKKLLADNGSSSKDSDFCYYAPWGNLAIFYKGYGGNEVVKIGIIQSEKENLTKIKDDSKVKIEILE